ncbi:hypothetical protein, partial [Pseudomonas aeruginosa]
SRRSRLARLTRSFSAPLRFLPVRIGDQALDGGGHRIVITSA